MHFEIYREGNASGFQTQVETNLRAFPRQGDYRWRLVADNGRIIADGSEGYTTLQACRHGISLVVGTTTETTVRIAVVGS